MKENDGRRVSRIYLNRASFGENLLLDQYLFGSYRSERYNRAQ
jgi:hypothetical protein